MAETIHTRPDGGSLRYASSPTGGYISRSVDRGIELLVPVAFADEERASLDAQSPVADDDAEQAIATKDEVLLRRLDDDEVDWRYGETIDDAQLQDGLRVLCQALGDTLSQVDSRLLESIVSRRDSGRDFPLTGRGSPPDWAMQVDRALRATTRQDATRAITLVAEELEHGRAGALSTAQSMRWWRFAEACGSDRARTRLLYLGMRSGDKAAARVARDRCIKHLRDSRQRSQADFVVFSKVNLLALEAALCLEDGELAALVVRHLAHADLLTIDDDKLAKLRILATTFHAKSKNAAVAPGNVRVIRSHVPGSEGREKDILNRLGSLMAPQPLAPWPADLGWADVLDAEFPWLANVTDQLRRQASMRMQMGGRAFRIDPVLIVGGTGIGKSSYQRRLGELTGVPSMMQSLAGAMDNMALKGSARGWGSSRPSAILDFMASNACPNPLVVLDEIDKASDETRNGNVWNTLLTMLERSTAARLQDEFVLGEVDLSHVNWMATANELGRMPSTLRSRLRIVETHGPAPEHFDVILHNILRDAARDLGVRVELLPSLHADILGALRNGFARSANMRVLARTVRDALAKASSWRPAASH